MQENIVDAEYREIDDEVVIVHDDVKSESLDVDIPKSKMTRRQYYNTIKTASESGDIDQSMFKKLKAELQIFNSEFTKTKVTKAQRKNKRKQQKTARKRNR